MRAGVTGSEGVMVGDGFGGGGTFSGGGVALVSGAIVVNGLESAREGAGATGTGAAAFTDFCAHPTVAVAMPHRQSTARIRGVMEGWGYPFCSANG